MSDARRAVFLSYAREDAAAAARLAEALRSQGVEVWFDQNELRGGDSWDQKIKTQIRECALFLPIVSAHTQERGEGYFRREWKLAVERTHDMAEGVPFLAPVVIDDTPDSAAAVPDPFLRVQWTRLPGALPSPEFVAQVKRLLQAPRKPTDAIRTGTPTSRGADGAEAASAGVRQAPLRRQRGWLVAAGVAALIAVASVAVWKSREGSTPAAAASAPSSNRLATPAVPNEKSIAVLPFANMSDDKDANAFFADGMHEDILTNLALIRELRVVSRTSVMGYRGTTKKIGEIARELGVAYVLEGSVRRAGNKVRVTGQLIRAATDEHLWAKNYDRDLTDVFAIQAELATEIAAALKTALSPQEKKLIEKPPTRNIAAYELALKARRLINDPDGPSRNRGQIVSLLEAALQLDPNYSAAYADLAYTYLYLLPPTAQPMLAKAKDAIDAAVRIDPDSPDVIRAIGDYYYYGLRDYPRAVEQYSKIVRLWPNDSTCYHRLGSVQRRQGRWLEVVANFRKAKELDPTNLNNVGGLAYTLLAGRRYADALTEFRYSAERRSDILLTRFMPAYVSFLAVGSTKEVDHFLGTLSPEELDSAEGVRLRTRWALRHGDIDEAIRLDEKSSDDSGPAVVIDIAAALMVRGRTDAARTRLRNLETNLRRQLKENETDSRSWSRLGNVLAIVGRRDEALDSARKGVELMPASSDEVFGAVARAERAFVYAWTGDKDAAIREYAALFRMPWSYMFGNTPESSVHVMKREPRYHPLRGDPRFEALLNDPKNNQPLF